ncbi:MAG: hypothetical protein VYA68_03200 [Pseudomonadota bacterium]|nr:hypothetical protein [Pseudomonadota bacterium]
MSISRQNQRAARPWAAVGDAWWRLNIIAPQVTRTAKAQQKARHPALVAGKTL